MGIMLAMCMAFVVVMTIVIIVIVVIIFLLLIILVKVIMIVIIMNINLLLLMKGHTSLIVAPTYWQKVYLPPTVLQHTKPIPTKPTTKFLTNNYHYLTRTDICS